MMFKEKKVIIVLILLSVNTQIIEIHTITDSQKISLHGVQFCN